MKRVLTRIGLGLLGMVVVASTMCPMSFAVSNDRFIVVTANSINKSLYQAITDGDIGGVPDFVQEVPSGSGTSFTLAYAPASAASVTLYIDGLLQTQGSGKDYTISGTGITLATALEVGQVIYAFYTK